MFIDPRVRKWERWREGERDTQRERETSIGYLLYAHLDWGWNLQPHGVCTGWHSNQLSHPPGHIYVFLTRHYLRLQGCNCAVGNECLYNPPSLPHCTGSKPLIDTFYSNFDSFVLTFTKLTEGNDLAYSFYLSISVTSLSGGCMSYGRKERAGTECTRVTYSNRVLLERR